MAHPVARRFLGAVVTALVIAGVLGVLLVIVGHFALDGMGLLIFWLVVLALAALLMLAGL